MKRTLVAVLFLGLLTVPSLYAAGSPEPTPAQAAADSSKALPEALTGSASHQPAIPVDPLADVLFKNHCPKCDKAQEECSASCAEIGCRGTVSCDLTTCTFLPCRCTICMI